MTPGTVDKVILQANETVRLVSKGKPDSNEAFWTFEAHTHDNDDHITLYRDEETFDQKNRKIQVNNHQGLVVFPDSGNIISAFLTNR